jgi:hypothetical protein
MRSLEKSIALGGVGERRMQSKGGGEEGFERLVRVGTAGKRVDKGGGGSFL